MKKIKPIYKSEKNISQWLISHFPNNQEELIYVEPYYSVSDVLLNKKKSAIEVINGVNVENIYKTLRDNPQEFIKKLKSNQYCEETFINAQNNKENDFEQAINEYILIKMSREGLKKSFSWTNRLRGGKPGAINVWEKALESLPELANRLKEVFIFNKSALEIIQTLNFENVLLYVDPPYLYENKVSKTVYSSKLTTNDHMELSRLLNNFNGKVIISGHYSPLYNRLYKNWNIDKKKTDDKDQKEEMIWKNY